jgi:hypothetical protein
VTHAGGEPLKEWLAIRPTSEAIIADSVRVSSITPDDLRQSIVTAAGALHRLGWRGGW